jgi:bisphosphoglycerate-dependent phosphoglycerate mutase
MTGGLLALSGRAKASGIENLFTGWHDCDLSEKGVYDRA